MKLGAVAKLSKRNMVMSINLIMTSCPSVMTSVDLYLDLDVMTSVDLDLNLFGRS